MRGVRAPREAAGVARALTMSFDLRGVKPDDVIGLFSRGEPPIPNYVPRHAAQKSGTDSPPCRIYFKRPARATLTSRIQIPRYAFVGPVGLWGPALYVDGGAPAILPVPGLLPAPSKCSNGHRTGNNHWLNRRCSVGRGAGHCCC
jgi:hypothetical protein